MPVKVQAKLPFVCQQSFLSDVRDGLGKKQKTLPCKYFYDDFGSQLFEQITDLDEYYLTRTELGILEQYADDIVAHFPEQATVIEPGCGSGQKVGRLITRRQDIKAFIPLEISTEMLSYTQTHLQSKFKHVAVHPLHGDFTHGPTIRELVRQHSLDSSANVVFFPGSTIGNFSPMAAIDILHNLRVLSGDNGQVIVGIDLIKDKARLEAAYDDKEGVTRAFNLNILTRISRELGACLCIEDFTHEARYNELLERVEMHIVAKHDTAISLGDQRYKMRAGESIHSENSHKYTLEGFEALCKSAKLDLKKAWQDDNQDFAVCLLKAN